MQAAGLKPAVIETFAHYYAKIRGGDDGLLHNTDIEPVASGDIKAIEDLDEFQARGRQALPQAVKVTLNGGLGTSMGLTGAKSLLKVKNGLSFLAIIVAQAQRAGVRLALMNSFSTHRDTQDALDTLAPAQPPLMFVQNKFPKILQDSLAPAQWPANPALEWNPPGHGDVYTALHTSDTLKQLIDQGIRYAFISNSDNLGATLDEALLGYFAANRFPFMMEVSRRTPADMKGGHLARHRSGRLILREAAQCPQDELDAFTDIGVYRYFNTNNIWIDLVFLQQLLAAESAVHLPMILNPKTLDPRDDASPPVYQVESAMGAAINLFDGATAVEVPRSRFFPVKSCNELMMVRSDVFSFTTDDRLTVNPARSAAGLSDRPTIKLDPKYYKKVDMFEARFAAGLPSLATCSSLQIKGDVHFEQNVVIQGEATIVNHSPEPAVIKAGACIEGLLEF